ncbi:DUF6519 domain-containing protein [Algicella marina]|uniref:Right handed beta helix domain-containing protein n=1 Tax=Algicella marina TaxID=2683284 RepID=A0A6P1T4J3_9RHOB|nr:DUF6519 domain-containing protein [Algicella marina]QHQ36665.1 hypothetical protein GO499_16540 [Algicella marina]
MSGDYSRDSFNALRDFASVYLQQGRPVLDSDWNEMVDIFERRIRTATVDTIGRAVVPRETIDGFEIRFTPAGDGLEIGRGRKYLDGILLECHGAANFTGGAPTLSDPVFDRARPDTTTPVGEGPEGVLDEMIPPPEGDFVPYGAQPYWPTPEDLVTQGTHVAYVVAWQREVTPVEMPSLLEPALGGNDTTTRLQTVWQVRTHPAPDGTTCATPDADIPGFEALTAPSPARLTTGTRDIEDPEDPCLVPPTEGYSGIENQFYRVEIHTPGEPDANGNPPAQEAASFKFSRENASVIAAVETITPSATAHSVTVSRIGRDEILRFRAGDWVELTDNHREFNHRSGEMLRIADVHPETREIEFETPIADAELIPSGAGSDTTTIRRTRLIRWDQRGVIRLADDAGTEWVDLDAPGADGLIPVPPAGTALVLENGITVEFSTAAGPGSYRAMDHWRFAARTAGTQVEELRQAPPDGIQRHYCRLAVVAFGTPNAPGSILDCRTFWPPVFEGDGEGCFCTVCVTAEQHNSGELTIQQAIDQIPAAGGTVCLEAGNYLLSDPVVVEDRNALTIAGQGLGTILLYQGEGAAFQVRTANDIQLERFSLLVAPDEDENGSPQLAHGIAAINTGLLAFRRLAVLVFGPNPEDSFNHGIALDGTQIGVKVEECVVVAPIALGSRSTFGLDADGDLTFAAFAELRVLDCILFGGRIAVQFDRVAMNISAALLSRNLVFSSGTGIRINWAEIPAASLSIDNSTIVADRTALLIGADTARILDCEISAGDEGGDGILLVPNIVPEARTDAQIIGNTIFDLAGAGIRISGIHDTILIKRNLIRRCDEAGIATTPEAEIRHIAIDNNAIEDITGITGELGAAGIVLTTAASGQIVGNGINDIGGGGQDGQVFAGIAVQGSAAIDISHNTIIAVGPDSAEVRAYGIYVAPPVLTVTISDNRIIARPAAAASDFLSWRGIQIGQDRVIDPDTTPGTTVGNITAELPTYRPNTAAYLSAGETVYRVAAASFVATPLGAPSQIGIRGNQVRSSRMVTQPLVQIIGAGARSIDFSNNQCDLQGVRDDIFVFDVVQAAAPRISLSANTITHNTFGTSIRLVTGANGAATPIGNITSEEIVLNGATLGQPFAALNLQA